jgi:hypothetical protein
VICELSRLRHGRWHAPTPSRLDVGINGIVLSLLGLKLGLKLESGVAPAPSLCLKPPAEVSVDPDSRRAIRWRRRSQVQIDTIVQYRKNRVSKKILSTVGTTIQERESP